MAGAAVIESRPKSRTGERLIWLDAETVRLLSEHRKAQLRQRLAMGDARRCTLGHADAAMTGSVMCRNPFSAASMQLSGVGRESNPPATRMPGLLRGPLAARAPLSRLRQLPGAVPADHLPMVPRPGQLSVADVPVRRVRRDQAAVA